MTMEDDLRFMKRALAQARRAGREGEVPVGAVLVSAGGSPLATGRNLMIARHDPTAHAEVVALRLAARRLGNYRLTGASLFVTLEPCLMCLGAIVTARVGRLVYAADDPKRGAVTASQTKEISRLFHHRLKVDRGPMAAESARMLRDFFNERRSVCRGRKQC